MCVSSLSFRAHRSISCIGQFAPTELVDRLTSAFVPPTTPSNVVAPVVFAASVKAPSSVPANRIAPAAASSTVFAPSVTASPLTTSNIYLKTLANWKCPSDILFCWSSPNIWVGVHTESPPPPTLSVHKPTHTLFPMLFVAVRSSSFE